MANLVLTALRNRWWRACAAPHSVPAVVYEAEGLTVDYVSAIARIQRFT